MTLPGVPDPIFQPAPALGAAYWKSPTAKERTLELISLLDGDDPVTFDPVSLHCVFTHYVTVINANVEV